MVSLNVAVILDAGNGSKLWPYAEVRSKGMVNISGKPMLWHTAEALRSVGVQHVIIVSARFAQEVRNYFRQDADITVISEGAPKGTAFSLLAAQHAVMAALGEDTSFLTLYSDTVLSASDILALQNASDGVATVASIAPLPGRSNDRIVCNVENGNIAEIWGHPREEGSHFFCGFVFGKEIFSKLTMNSGRFTNTEVGMMSPMEGYLEMTLADMLADGEKIVAAVAQESIVDVDKPWQILEANAVLNRRRCGALTENVLAEDAEIHPSAVLNGFVSLGRGSRIGRNVIIEGNVIIGEGSVVENGAILRGNVVIGDDAKVLNYCLVGDYSTVGNHCYVGHGAELSGILFDTSYLYHYMEFYGIVGEHTDLGAATVCGTLRFDDGVTRQRTKGRGEEAHLFSDAIFLGDYCRTGVNAILMPGVKVGIYSVVGAGVTLMHDLEDRTLLYAEQTQVKKAWGPEKYGW
ncbi:MAG: NDP-sugar synthase [Oscillospiraceae bacterium]|jgi:bifunctional UDP-N-acetylglucosamine pyrophosphorylase/glucosamine-1-phosphate N-acetyltransferase|nr:NDP-sugar synthase [Oscillospiraceae bacterium]